MCVTFSLDTIDKDNEGSFQRQHAEIIKSFLFSLPQETTDLFICCDGGDSRSPAVAAAIMRFIGRDEQKVWMNPYYTPNILVYFVLCRGFGIPITWEDAMKYRIISDNAYTIAQNNNGKTEYKRWEVL